MAAAGHGGGPAGGAGGRDRRDQGAAGGAKGDARADDVGAEGDALAHTITASAGAEAPAEATVPGRRGASSGKPGAFERGAALGRYTILEKLGEGGMGVVYSAYDPDLDRKVALKLLRVGQRVSDAARSRLLREARAMAKLSHPNVITVFEVGTVGACDFVAMEFVQGTTLAGWLAEGDRSWREVVEVFLAAGRGLAAAHGAGLVHRDFKPANVLMSKEGRVVVTDFGLARSRRRDPESIALEETAPPSGDEQPGLDAITRTGAVVGTPAYMAPEQHLGREADERTDQFSFCVALFEGLHGSRPFAGDSIEELRDATTSGRLAEAGATSSVPGKVRRAVRRGLSAERDERFRSMDALLSDLSRAAVRRRNGWAIAALGAVAALLAGVLASPGERGSAALCESADEKLAGIWDEEAEAAVREAFTVGGGKGARAAFDTVTERLDAYAARWASAYSETCDDAYGAGGEAAEADFYLVRRCLLQRRRELRSLVEVFRDPEAPAVEQSVQAAQRLPPVAACTDVEALRAGVPPPEDAATRDRVEALREELTDIRALQEASRFEDGLERANDAVARAREIAYRPVLAEALLRLGELHIAANHVSEGREALEEADFVAEIGGYQELRARALVARVETEATFSSDHEATRKLARRARAAIERYGRDDTLEARLGRSLARVFSEQGRYDEAEAALRGALATYRRQEGEHSIRAADTKLALAHLMSIRGRFEEAVASRRQALATIRDQLGDDHPKVARATTSLAGELQNVGRHDEARTLRERAAGFWERDTGRELLRYARVLVPADNVGRRVSGRVTDSRGEPVEGAEVSVGAMLIGDGKYADTTRGSRTYRVWRARTGPDGRFEVSGVTAEAAAAIAEHADLGRSLPARVAPARDVADLGLELRPFGRLEGAVRFRGDRPPVVRVVARPIESELGRAAAVFGVTLRPDDRYVFERLAAGRYAVTLSASAVQAQAGIQTREVVVRPGETVRLESVFEQEGRTVVIDVASAGEGTIPVAQVLVFRGRHDYATVGEIRALGSRLKELGEVGWVYPGRPARLPGVEPGQNTVCAIPLPGDLKNPEVARRMDRHDEDFPSHCRPFDLEPGAGTHSLTMRVPATEMPASDASE